MPAAQVSVATLKRIYDAQKRDNAELERLRNLERRVWAVARKAQRISPYALIRVAELVDALDQEHAP